MNRNSWYGRDEKYAALFRSISGMRLIQAPKNLWSTTPVLELTIENVYDNEDRHPDIKFFEKPFLHLLSVLMPSDSSQIRNKGIVWCYCKASDFSVLFRVSSSQEDKSPEPDSEERRGRSSSSARVLIMAGWKKSREEQQRSVGVMRSCLFDSALALALT